MELVKKIKKVNLLFLLKTGIGSAIAILLADSLGFLYSPSAGIITLLTIQNTKKETLLIALKRLEAFILASLITYAIFNLFGYSPLAFGVIIFFFVALCILTGLKDGIAMNAVLMTHFLIEERMDFPFILNELGILFIGMLIGIALNLIMPRNKQKIRKEQLSLEEDIKITLRGMARLLREKEACLIQDIGNPKTSEELKRYTEANMIDTDIILINFNTLQDTLDRLLKTAYEEAGNTLLSDTRYLISYLEMRKLQLEVLKDITMNIESIPVILQQIFPIAEFLFSISSSFHELNNVSGLLKELEVLKEHYRNEKLPQTREEFEYRATLFHILKELEYFLLLKQNFVFEINKKNMKSYWSEQEV